ncbi:transposase [Sorangium sp. So ce1128]
MTFVQRFDSMLGSFVHFHVVALDGVFTRKDGPEVVFHQGPAPSRDDIAAVAARVEKRMMRWLRRRKLVDDRPSEERSNEVPELSPLEACMQLSLFGGTFVRLDEDGVPLAEADDEDRFRPRGKSPWAGEVAGFNIHAGVTIRAGDRAGLERLCRYGARPPFSLERIWLLPDGRVAYRLRKPRRNGATHLVLAPVHFLARIAALVPPPRYPLLRLSGVLASGSSWRAAVVAHGPAATSIPVPETKTKTKTSATAPPTCASVATGAAATGRWPAPRLPNRGCRTKSYWQGERPAIAARSCSTRIGLTRCSAKPASALRARSCI